MAINFVISVDPNVTAILKAVASGLTNNGTQIAQVQADLAETKETLKKMNDDIKAAADAQAAAFVELNAALDNIVTDEAALAQQIADLNAKLEAGQTLSAEDKAALAGIASAATGMAARTKSIADAVPDAPVEVPPAA